MKIPMVPRQVKIAMLPVLLMVTMMLLVTFIPPSWLPATVIIWFAASWFIMRKVAG